jgi:hypothetical protein
LILPAVLVRRGKYSVADPLFVEERRPVLVARKLRRGAEAGDIVLVSAREKKPLAARRGHARYRFVQGPAQRLRGALRLHRHRQDLP